MQTIFKQVPIEQLQRGQYQPRQVFDDAKLQELAQSIRSQGLIEPLIVRRIQPSGFEIIAGERRFRAALLAGLSTIPCLINDYTDKDAAAVSLIENIQRADLNLMEEANGYHRLQKEFHFNQDDIAVLVGKSRSHIANILRLLTLCDAVQEALRTQQLSLGHARMLVGLSPQLQLKFKSQILAGAWSVRRLEEAVRLAKMAPPTTIDSSNNCDKQRLQIKLAEQMGAPVEIISDSAEDGGFLKIKFFDNDMLSGLLERMGLSYD